MIMQKGWQWAPTLYKGAAPHYARGRLPYPSARAGRFRLGADLRGVPRLIDVGCGPGTVAVALAGLFAEVIGVDPDPGYARRGDEASSGVRRRER